MKTILLIAFLALASHSFAQVKLQAISSYNFYEIGGDSLTTIDSLSYIYNSSNGSLNSFKPEFLFSADFGDYYFYWNDYFLFEPAENTNPDLFQIYFGLGNQFEFQYEIANTFTNGYISEANYPNFRYVYVHDNNGNQLSRLKQEFDGTWTTIEGVVKTFDTNNNTTTKQFYNSNIPGQLFLMILDSITYDQVSGDVLQLRRFGYDESGNGGLYYQANYTYSGNEMDFIDYYGFNSLGEEVWESRKDCTYSNGLLVTISDYGVWNDVISTNPNRIETYTYNSDGQLIEDQEYVNGNLMLKVELSYYNANFLKQKKLYSAYATGVLTYENTQNYYYSGILGIEQENLVSVSLFPNPTNDILTIQSDSPITKVEVKNLTGQTILEQKSETIDLSSFASGTYFVSGQTENGNFVEKVMKL